jgi:hypothetical protein
MNTSDEMSSFVQTFNESSPTWSDLLTIDYFYHHHEHNYDYGISFIDRIYKKLGRFHPEWNIPQMKAYIYKSLDPVSVYTHTIEYMLSDPTDVLYYGI